MSSKKRLALALTLASSCVFLTPDAEACSCMRPPGPKEALEASDHVVLARVANVEKLKRDAKSNMPPALRVTLEVERAYKGEEDTTLVVMTATNSAACGYPFETSGRYLVFANDGPDSGVWVSLCSRTGRADAANEDLAALDGLAPAPPRDNPETPRPRAEPEPTPANVSPPPVQVEPVSPPSPASPTTSAPPSQPPSQRGCACTLTSSMGTEAAPSALLALLVWRRRYLRRR